MLARFDGRGRKQGGDVRVDDTDEGGKWLPQVALDGPVPVVVWIDERDRGPQDLPFEHVYAARGTAGGGFGANVRVDAGAPVALAHISTTSGARRSPRAGGKVFVAWSDFRDYNWDVYFARSDDGGLTFGANRRIDDFQGFERLNERATLAIDPGGRVHAAWTDLRAREPDTNIFYARSDNGGATFSANRQLDDSKRGLRPEPRHAHEPVAPRTGRGRRPPVRRLAGQPPRQQRHLLHLQRRRRRDFAAAERVDDTGAGQSEQSRPSLAWSEGWCYVAWEDNRSGTGDVFTGRRSCPAQ